jgi:hypothetical protein
MIRGSCLCKDVTWESAEPALFIGHCHCSMCRKSHGTPFGTVVAVPAAGFRFSSGEPAKITGYASSPEQERAFCKRCGSLVPRPQPDSENVMMPAGGLDDDPGVRPGGHTFVGSKAPWYEIPEDGTPRFDAYPPGMGEPFQETKRATEPRAGAVRGSCLCGGVAYEVEGKLALMIQCHCSRCRKTRGAAHGCNAFCKEQRFGWLRGEELIDQYKPPDAVSFVFAFCRVCGSGVPRITSEAVVIPAGTFDDDPGARPNFHIYTGSKAPWFEIADDLRQFEGAPPGA